MPKYDDPVTEGFSTLYDVMCEMRDLLEEIYETLLAIEKRISIMSADMEIAAFDKIADTLDTTIPSEEESNETA